MSATTQFVSALAPVIERHIALQRALGCSYDSPLRLLRQFDRFLAAQGTSDLTAQTFSAWCSSIERLTANGRRLRMQTVHRLCVYRRRSEPTCFVPDPSQFPPRQPAARPYIFSEEQIGQILRAADALHPDEHSPLHPQVARYAIVLLYTAGLRRGEVARLTLGDYDPVEHVLLVRESKFHKSRLIPLSMDAAAETERYLRERLGRGFSRGADAPLLLHTIHGSAGYTDFSLSQLVKRAIRASGVRNAAGRAPRVHDLRFTFAIHALLRWYRAHVDVQTRLPALATYMGHNTVESTFYYLPFFEEVAQLASERFDRHCTRFLGPAAPQKRGDQ